MKKKTVGKTRHVVAWMNKAEYEHVLEYLFSKEPALQKHALHRISAWKGRYGGQGWICCDSDRGGQIKEMILLYHCSQK
uniref:Uncharacterized protein n=1 Tax=Sinocyclocheilus rhinocerous TaxID=307959 RepID=A0A673G221_9TELE